MSGPTYAVSLGTLGSPGNSPGTEALGENRLFPRSTTTSAIFQVTDKPVLLRAFGLPPGAVLSLEMVFGDGTSFQAAPFVLAGATYTLTPTNNVLAVSVEGRYRLVLTGAASTAVTVSAIEVALDYGNLSMARQGLASGGILVDGLTPASLPLSNADLAVVSQAGSALRRVTVADLAGYATSVAAAYTAPFTGAVARSVRSKLAEVISATDFGATGNGTTNDLVALQAAVNAIPLGQSRRISLPPGNYNLGADYIRNNGRAPVLDLLPGASLSNTVGAGIEFPQRTTRYITDGNSRLLYENIAASPDIGVATNTTAVGRYTLVTNLGPGPGYGQRIDYRRDGSPGVEGYDVAHGRLAIFNRTNGQDAGYGLTDWVVTLSPTVGNASTRWGVFCWEHNITNRAGAYTAPYRMRVDAIADVGQYTLIGQIVPESNTFGNGGTTYDVYAGLMFSQSAAAHSHHLGRPARVWIGILGEPNSIRGGGYAVRWAGNDLVGTADNPAALVYADGKWNYGIDLSAAVFANSALRLPNNQAGVTGRNAANNADVELLRLNASDQLVLGGQLVLPWQDFTPTITADTGTFTSVSVSLARWRRIQNTIEGVVVLNPVTVGTAGGAVRVTLPTTAGAYGGDVTGFNLAAGLGLTGVISASSGFLRALRYDAATPIVAGQPLRVAFRYEV